MDELNYELADTMARKKARVENNKAPEDTDAMGNFHRFDIS